MVKIYNPSTEIKNGLPVPLVYYVFIVLFF